MTIESYVDGTVKTVHVFSWDMLKFQQLLTKKRKICRSCVAISEKWIVKSFLLNNAWLHKHYVAYLKINIIVKTSSCVTDMAGPLILELYNHL